MIEKNKMDLIMDPVLETKLRMGALVQQDILFSEARGEALTKAIAETEHEMRSSYGGLTPSQIPGLKPARKLYRSIGVDPTRTRPASEALVRRVIKGGSIPKISQPVDAANLVSLRSMTPIGLYDLDLIRNRPEVRLGRPGESFQRIGKGTLNLEGRIGLFDSEGGFGNPTGDSRRTCVNGNTKNILFTAFFPADTFPADIMDMMCGAKEILTRYVGGQSILLGDKGFVMERAE